MPRLGEDHARALARRVAELRFAGQSGALTFSQLAALYQQHRVPLLSPARQRTIMRKVGLLERHFGSAFQVHPHGRLWAMERRHVPAQDVAAAGGWRSLAVMRAAYQHADAQGVHSVVVNNPAAPAASRRRRRPTAQK